MPATYEPIATTTLGSAAATITFSSIPNTYTDLRLVFVPTSAASALAELQIRFNSDTGTNYSMTQIYGDGSVAASDRNTSQTSIKGFYSYTFNQFSALFDINIFSYAGSTNKTVLLRNASDRNGAGSVDAQVGLWRNTAAITRVDLLASGANFNTGTTATLYGIKAA